MSRAVTVVQTGALLPRDFAILEGWWSRIAIEERLPQLSVARVTALLHNAMAQSTVEFAQADASRLEQPLRRLINCERLNYLGNGESDAATDFFVASCILRAISRQSADTITRREAVRYYEQLIDGLLARVHRELAARLEAQVLARWEPSIRQLLDAVNGKLRARVAELNGDPLYPGFKEQFPFAAEAKLFEECLGIAIVPPYGKPKTMMITDDEDYARQLGIFAPNLIRAFLFFATEEEIRPALEKMTYWGRCQILFSARDGFWPIDIRIIPVAAETSNRTVQKDNSP
jgi:hypothetical protein